MEKVALRNCGCLMSGTIQCQVLRGFEQPDLVSGIPTHRIEARGSLKSFPTKTILWFYADSLIIVYVIGSVANSNTRDSLKFFDRSSKCQSFLFIKSIPTSQGVNCPVMKSYFPLKGASWKSGREGHCK